MYLKAAGLVTCIYKEGFEQGGDTIFIDIHSLTLEPSCDTGRVSESIEGCRVDGVWFGELSGTNVVVIKMRVKNTTNIDKVASS